MWTASLGTLHESPQTAHTMHVHVCVGVLELGVCVNDEIGKVCMGVCVRVNGCGSVLACVCVCVGVHVCVYLTAVIMC